VNRTFWISLVAAVALGSVTQAQTVLNRIRANNAQLGTSMAVLSDIDGDAIPEVAIGALGQQAVWVVSGRTGGSLFSVSPGGTLSFGLRVRAAGDVDGDGLVDFIAPSWKDNWYAGSVRVYSGSNGALLFTYQGTPYDRVGRDVDGVGDLDGDGRSEFIIGADGEQTYGVARVYSGATGNVLYTLLGATYGGSGFGAGVGGVGDVDADGFPDFAVGTPFTSPALGAVRVFSGRDASLLLTVTNPPGNGTYGRTIVGAGDANRDGYSDFAVGDSHWGNGYHGAVLVYSGSNGALLYTLSGDGCTGDGDPNVDPHFGNEIALLGDLDNDGVADLGVGGMNEARVFSGATGSLLETFHEPPVFGFLGDVFSTSIAAVPDLDGDGRRDVLVGWMFPSLVTWYADGLYLPAGTLMTFGDGSGAPCPCGNNGQSLAGCANSTGFGAELRAWGSTSLRRDTFYFEVSRVKPYNASQLFVGTQSINGGLGAPFGDGLRGAGGAPTRLGTHSACGDGRTIWGPGLAQNALWHAGDTRTFQVWYRDPLGPCGALYNLSNCVQMTFAP
jgi:hypothetical protein